MQNLNELFQYTVEVDTLSSGVKWGGGGGCVMGVHACVHQQQCRGKIL